MDQITIIWSMAAAMCLTLAGIHLIVALQKRTDWRQFLFVSGALGVAAVSAFELLLMRSQSAVEYGTLIRWGQIPLTVFTLSIMWFLRYYLKAGRLWLAWVSTGIRLFSLMINFVVEPNLNFRKITRIDQVPFLGEMVSVPVGIVNPWAAFSQFGGTLMIAFCIDATITAWRRRGERRGVLIGAGTVFFFICALGVGVSVTWGLVHAPIVFSPMFVGILLVIGYELGFDLSRARQLASDLHENKERMAAAVEAGDLGIWIRDLVKGEIWANHEWRSLFEFDASEKLDLERILQKLHPDDRGHTRETFANTAAGGYDTEYRILLADGRLRWIASHGRIEHDPNGRPLAARGVSLDITTRKATEDAANELSGRLINTLEEERERLARELHDDLSQTLALLSIELEMLGQKPPDDSETITLRMGELSKRVNGLSADIRRLSHEIHPSTLHLLGLVSATRSFCREINTAHKIAVEFEDHDVPQKLTDEVSLCVYRIIQESLQNVVKHSGAAAAKVILAGDENGLRLTVSDNGSGFDPQGTRAKSSLGLVSMRERIRLVNGKFSIESQKGAGTRVVASVPVLSAQRTMHNDERGLAVRVETRV